jgi:hypothetical protein
MMLSTLTSIVAIQHNDLQKSCKREPNFAFRSTGVSFEYLLSPWRLWRRVGQVNSYCAGFILFALRILFARGLKAQIDHVYHPLSNSVDLPKQS